MRAFRRPLPLIPAVLVIAVIAAFAAIALVVSTDSGPQPSTAATKTATPTPLTAAFEGVPESHTGAPFMLRLALSEPLGISYLTVRDHVLAVSGGTVSAAWRVDGRGDLWGIELTPDGTGAVTVVLEADRPCGTPGALCAADGQRLSTRLELTVPGPPPPPCERGTAVPDPGANPGLVADCAALLGLGDALRGSASLNWSADLGLRAWDGVSVAGTPPRVTKLSLSRRVLTGSIPPALGGLDALTELRLYGNQLTGSIPAALGGLANLEFLLLDGNELSGPIPAELGNLANLLELWLFGNELSGSIPAALGRLALLEGLRLNGNALTGEIPPELGGLTALRAIALSGNALTGCIPRGFANALHSDLDRLGLEDCGLPSTTLSYDTYDTTGAVTAAGSYAFLGGEDGSSVVTTYEGLRDGSATRLRIHASDAGGASRAGFYHGVEAGDLFEWRKADDCFVRYVVDEVMPDTASSTMRKELAVSWVTYAYAGCGGAISASGARKIGWSPPDLQSPGMTSPVRHGPWLLVPPDWEGEVQQAVRRTPALPGSAGDTRGASGGAGNPGPGGVSLPPHLPPWREPVVPEEWTFYGIGYGDRILHPPYGYTAYYRNERGYQALSINVYYSEWSPVRIYANKAGGWVIKELRVIDGNPVLLTYSPPDNEKGRLATTYASVFDISSGIGYSVYGHDRNLRGSNIEPVLAIALGLLPPADGGAAAP